VCSCLCSCVCLYVCAYMCFCVCECIYVCVWVGGGVCADMHLCVYTHRCGDQKLISDVSLDHSPSHFLETLSQPEPHQFVYASWPVSCRDPQASAPAAQGVLGIHMCVTILAFMKASKLGSSCLPVKHLSPKPLPLLLSFLMDSFLFV